MNRTDRLYALVEELRAVAPGVRSARDLAERFEVSVRTIERDLSALQQAGVPIWAEPGRRGGYAVDPAHTLPPVNFTAPEAAAIAIALARGGEMPFGASARTALRKVLHAMGAAADDARALADKVALVGDGRRPRGVSAVLEHAVTEREVLAIDYVDKDGRRTRREVEPFGFVGTDDHWYLVAWCRLRDDARSFRADRIERAVATGEPALERPIELVGEELVAVVRRPLALD